ncbi:MAG: phosphotransferase [Xanthobacteraceae bacterium]
MRLSHQDFRPANICTNGKHITAVLDWDMARPDCPLYDVAFASLQFGGRECLFDDISLDLAHLFLRTYVRHAGLQPWLLAHPEIMSWIYRVTILKRLLHNWHVANRTRLLRRLEAVLPGWFFVNGASA